MLHYELSPQMRLILKEHHRAVQGAIAVLANTQFGTIVQPQGIFKYEGGVVVNKREIAIHEDYVIDDWKKVGEPTAEETAVVDAITAVEGLWRVNGRAAVAAFPAVFHGDPLRCMLRVT